MLVVVAVGCGAGAALEEAAVADPPEPVGGPHLATPVVSARRVPTLVAAPVADRRLRADLAAWAMDAPAPSCALVADPDGEVVLAHRPDEPVVPASTLKLLTAAAALAELGPDHRYRTRALAPAPVAGAVVGDLFLVGGGDPILASADYASRFRRQPQVFTDLEDLAVAVAGAGITRIDGAVVGDESRYDQERYRPDWPSRYVTGGDVGPMSALSVNDGWAEYPTSEAGRPLVPAPDPAAAAAGVFTFLLEANGVDVAGPPRSGVAGPDLTEVAVLESPPLSDVVTQLLEESDNNTAELLLKEVGRAAGAPTTVGGLARAADALAVEGIELDGAVLADGSGLSLGNRLTCELLVEVLQHPSTGPALRAALPVAGRSGTLTEAFVETPLEGTLAAKTGSLNSVAALAGVVDDEDEPLTFAYIANAPPGQVVDGRAVVAAQLRLGEILAAWPRVPDVRALGPQPVRGR